MYTVIVLDSIYETFKLTEDQLLSPGKAGQRVSEARRVAAAVLAQSGYTRERIAEILKFADGSGVTKAIQQHEQIISSKDVTFNAYLDDYILSKLSVNRRIAENYTEESGIQPLPIPELPRQK